MSHSSHCSHGALLRNAAPKRLGKTSNDRAARSHASTAGRASSAPSAVVLVLFGSRWAGTGSKYVVVQSKGSMDSSIAANNQFPVAKNGPSDGAVG